MCRIPFLKIPLILLLLNILLSSCIGLDPHHDKPNEPNGKYPDPLKYSNMMGNGFATDWFKGSTLANRYTQTSLIQTIQDLKRKGFNNLRLRSRADIWGFPDADESKHYPAKRMDPNMSKYLNELENVVDVMIAADMYPVISWIHHNAEGRADCYSSDKTTATCSANIPPGYSGQEDGENYVTWWTAVAERLKSKSYHLAFNLMTEVGKQDDDGDGVNGVYDQTKVYNNWTRRALTAIRNTGGNNAQRIVIITAPQNTQEDSLSDIDTQITQQAQIMIEYHSYAAGPSAKGRNPWSGTGSSTDRSALTDRLDALKNFTAKTSIPFYWGAWMAKDNNKGTMDQAERDAFATFFVEQLKAYHIPWAMNKLEDFYDTNSNTWITDADPVDTTTVRDKPNQTLDAIFAAMQ